MLKVEEKYHERVETKSPMRVQTHHHHEFDNNLDYLLEDLQNSITRPEPIMDHHHHHHRHTSPARVTSLRPANQITEYASDDAYSRLPSDGGKNVKTVKKEVYSYQSSSTGGVPHENTRIRNNINELDSLLDDLQQVKQSPDAYKSSSGQNYREYSKSKVISGKTVVENVYPETPVSSKSYISHSAGPDESVTSETQYLNEGTYGNIKTRSSATPPPPPPPSSSGRSNTLTRQTKITNVHSYPIEVVETTTPEMNTDILASLDPTLLPTGNTKVTTTIKTYTYEIPGTVYPSTSPNTTVDSTEKYVYSPNDTQTTPSKSFVYNKYENNTTSQNVNYVNDQQQYRTTDTTYNIRPQPSPVIPDDRRVVTETVTTSRNYQPAPVYPDNYGKQTHVVKESTLTRSTGTNTLPFDRPPHSPPLIDDRNVTKETIISRNYQPGNTYIDSTGKQMYVYNESTLTRSTGTNTDYPPSGIESPAIRHPYPGSKSSPSPTHGGPPYDHTVTITTTRETNYRDDRNKPPPSQYNTSSSIYSEKYRTDSNYDENKPLMHYPGRFPTDRDAPPKKLDELMATIGDEPPNSPLNAGFNAHEIELAQQKKVDTLKMQQKEAEKDDQKKLQHTKNVSGPPVYYPPGHELFLTKTESGGVGWRAEGAMAKESGKYKYEAESKSKTKTKAAVVPVCLPLCCGLPCTIL